MTQPVTPVAFAERLRDHLLKANPVTPTQLSEAKSFVRSRRDIRCEPLTRKGHEYVVETLCRPAVEGFAEMALSELPAVALDRVYSSHFHTSRDAPSDYERKWKAFKRAHPDVDTQHDGHSRRADLFVSLDGNKLVSVEFKYVPPRRTPSVESCLRQVQQHLSKHVASILVIYAADPPSRRLADAVERIRAELAPRSGFVVPINGPAILFP